MRYIDAPNVSMLFIAAVLVCAISQGVASGIAAAIFAFLAYDFFFIQPVYTFTVSEPRELLVLAVFLLVGIFTGGLAGRVREQTNAAYKRITTIRSLYDVSRKLAGATDIDDVLWVLARQIAAAAKGHAMILLPERTTGDTLVIRAAFPPEDELPPGDWAAARRPRRR